MQDCGFGLGIFREIAAKEKEMLHLGDVQNDAPLV
jgi:hypothetical protein